MQKVHLTEYEKQKPDKKLRYVLNVGTVELTVEMDSGETLHLTVTPLQAAIIELFSQQRASHRRHSYISLQRDSDDFTSSPHTSLQVDGHPRTSPQN